MAKYLLSTGSSTNDVILYVKDLISFGLRIPKDSVPHYSFGTDQIVKSIIFSDMESNIRTIITELLNKIQSNNRGLSLSLQSLAIINNTAQISIQINDEVAKYNVII